MSVVITLCVITDNCNCVSALEETFILHTRSCKNGFDLNIRKLKMWGVFFFLPSCFPISARAFIGRFPDFTRLSWWEQQLQDERGHFMEWYWRGDTECSECSEETPSKSQFVHHRSRRNWPGFEPWAPRWRSAATLWRLYTVEAFSVRHSATLCEVWISTVA